MTVEFFGTVRLRAGRPSVEVEASSLGDALRTIATLMPATLRLSTFHAPPTLVSDQVAAIGCAPGLVTCVITSAPPPAVGWVRTTRTVARQTDCQRSRVRTGTAIDEIAMGLRRSKLSPPDSRRRRAGFPPIEEGFVGSKSRPRPVEIPMEPPVGGRPLFQSFQPALSTDQRPSRWCSTNMLPWAS